MSEVWVGAGSPGVAGPDSEQRATARRRPLESGAAGSPVEAAASDRSPARPGGSHRRREASAELLRLAASLERASEHPLGAAIVDAAEERGLALADATDFR
ncbi:MAG: hypothetical protein GWN71_09920, partial [Gammaproteobacteria bacterium]|nr:hypothetical protein [Gammaproteobacteria bacterium]NIY08181.1 hypothetical protein [Gemmatimonadota bacterium]